MIETASRPDSRKRSSAVWLGLLAVIVFFGWLRLRLLEVPLERDEGEYAYIAQLMLRGIPPYLAAYSMKLPGIFLVYAGILLAFGQTAAGIHLGLLVAVSLSTVLVFVLARRLLNDAGAIAAAACFALLSAGQAVKGFNANAEPFILPLALGGLLLLLKGLEGRQAGLWLFLSGLSFGGAFLIKQHGAAFGIFGGLYLLGALGRARTDPLRRKIAMLAVYVCGTILPFATVVLIFISLGIFRKFWFYTFVYSRTYVSHTSMDEAMVSLFWSLRDVVVAAPLIWAAAVLGLFFVARKRWAGGSRSFWVGFAAVSFLALVPGFYFRTHYFILVFPAIACLTGAAAMTALKAFKKAIPGRRAFGAVVALLAVVFFGSQIYHQRKLFFAANAWEASWEMYGPQPFFFNEARQIAQRLKPSLSAEDTIAVVGSEPEIYFYLGRKAPTGFLYIYYLTEEQPYAPAMQAEFIRDLESKLPDYLIYASSWKAGYVSPEAYDGLFRWYEKFRDRHYELIGLVDIISRRLTIFRWDDEVRGYKFRSPCRILVYRRRAPLSE